MCPSIIKFSGFPPLVRRTVAAAVFVALAMTSMRAVYAVQLEVVRHLPMPTAGPNSLDPVRGSSQYDNRACNMVFETLLEYEYLERPYKLKPCLLAEMPIVTDGGKRFRFRLKKGVRFHDDPCFPDGKGREMVADDVFYSFKRMADKRNSPKAWWLLQDTIVGFDQWRTDQNAADEKRQAFIEEKKEAGKEDSESAAPIGFDYDAPVEGMKKINDYEFEILLKQPFFRFTYTLAMFQTSVVAREAAEHYGKTISRHPVGTGPFTLRHEDWESGAFMSLKRNPTYREDYYPADPGLNEDGSEPYPGYTEDKKLGFYEDAGKRLPLADRVEVSFFVTTQPMWLKFRNREIDYTTVPAETFEQAFIKRTQKLRQSYRDEGIRFTPVPLLDFIYNGFNMEDPDFGGYTEKKKYLRQAISLAYDYQEANQAFYNNLNIIYDGVIPPGLEGHPDNHRAPKNYRGPRLSEARKLLVKAGHPSGKGLPTLVYYTSKQPQSVAMAEMAKRNLKKIGVNMDVRAVDFSTLTDLQREKRAPYFGLAWGSDYPDAENNLQLFYGPFKSPGSNNFNYDRPEYNKMYERARVMAPSPERTKLYEEMRDMLIEDVPFVGSMARTRFYLTHDRLKNFKPVEVFFNWPKYMNIKEN